MDECPICYHEGDLVQIQPCNHSFCKPCAIKTLVNFNMTCSLCRQTSCGIVDSISSKNTIVINVGNGKHAGITLTNHKKGVRVKSLVKQDEGYKKLKKNDVISEINGVPTFAHNDAVKSINTATIHSLPIHITLKN